MKTLPKERWWQTLLDWLLWPIMKLFATGLLTHPWHWLAVIIPKENWSYVGVVVIPGDPTTHSRSQNNWLSLIQSHLSGWLGGWTKGVVLEPRNYNLAWFLAFQTIEGNGQLIQQRCTIILHGPVRALVGPSQVKFIALDYHGQTIPLRLITTTKRDDPKWKHVPLI